MKAICVREPNTIILEERPMPEIQLPHDVLVKIKAAGICGSDVHIYHGTSPVATYPRVIGHEIAGEIIEKGESVNELSIGDHVVMDPVIYCGNCYACRIGRRNVCSNLKVRSVHVDGGYQEYLVLPESSVYKIPDAMSLEEAVMIEPFTIAEQVCSRGEISKDDTVFIMGAGPAGLSILIRAKLSGATCIISDIVENRLEIARSFGADLTIHAATADVLKTLMEYTGGQGATVVIDAVCNTKSFEQTLDYVCSAGRVVTLGFNAQPSSISQLRITAREIDIRGSRLHNNKFPSVIELFSSGKLNIKSMITHRFPFMKIKEALTLIDDPGIEKGKVVLEF